MQIVGGTFSPLFIGEVTVTALQVSIINAEEAFSPLFIGEVTVTTGGDGHTANDLIFDRLSVPYSSGK